MTSEIKDNIIKLIKSNMPSSINLDVQLSNKIFTDLGYTSLTYMTLIVQIELEYDITIDVSQAYNNQITVSEFLNIVSQLI